MSGRNLYVAHSRVALTRTVSQYDDSGSGEVLSFIDTVGTANSIAVDNNENIYTGGSNSSSITTRKYNSSGVLQWTANHGTTVNAIAVDSDGNVYTAGNRTSNLTVRKYNSAGVLQWSADTGATARGIAVDSDGFVYVCGSVSSYNNLRCYDTDGNLKWSKYVVGVGAVCYSVACDNNGHLLVGTDYSSRAINKLNLVSGNTSAPGDAWYMPHGSIYSVTFDEDGNCYGTGSNVGGYTTRKYSSDGSLLWSGSHGATTTGIYVGKDKSIYIAGQYSGSITVRKWDSSGNLAYSFDAGSIANAIALFEPEGVSAPVDAVGFPVSLALPYAARFIRAYPPAAPIGIDLGLPDTPEHRPPSLVDYPASRIYRLYFPGGDGFTEWPLASLQCQRRLGASTWLTVVIPGWSAEMESAVVAQVGQDLRVFAGAVVDGSEVLGEFLRAIITEYQVDRSPGAASITLTGRVQTPSYSSASRELVGVTERGRDAAGRRRAQCAVVDPLLRPNDTIDDGEETWVVGSILYRMSPDSSVMTVEERGE